MARDLQAIADVLNERLGLEFETEGIAKVINGIGQKDLKARKSWSTCTWIMWFKNRINFQIGGAEAPVSFPGTPLHFFFITIPETPGMKGRLAEGRLSEPLREFLALARSKLSSSNLADVRPIDRVAQRVSPKEMQK